MSDIYSLLNIDGDVIKDFHLLADRVADHQVEKIVNANARRLREIENSMFSDKQVTASAESIEDVIQRVRKASKRKNEERWAPHDLRLISYYLIKLQGDDTAFDYALRILEQNWRNMYFNGLVFSCLNSWNTLRRDYREKTCKLIVDQLQSYDGTNKRYLQLKNHLNFFDENGPLRMAALLSAKGMSPYDAPTLIGYKSSSFSMSYYSDVIINYYSKNPTDDYSTLESILGLHNNDRTRKLLYANLVEDAERRGSPLDQSRISKSASRMLGDVSIASTWAPFSGASEKDIEKLRKAKNLINLWFARKIIEVFFEVCVQDESRKRFWLEYVDYVKDFRVAGSSAVRLNMQRDSRIGTMFGRYFIETASKKSQTAALILCMKDKVIVEFSDLGALYVYNHGHEKVAPLDRRIRYIDSIEDLKLPSINMLVDEDYYSRHFYEEGRLRHAGNWVSRMSAWMNLVLIKQERPEIGFSDSIDRKVFKAETSTGPVSDVNNPDSSKSANGRMDTLDVPDLPESLFPEDRFLPEDDDAQPYQHSGTVSTPQPHLRRVNVLVGSRWVFAEKCRVVMSDDGYYLHLKGDNSFVNLRPLEREIKNGTIWIRMPDSGGWCNIVHQTFIQTIQVGQIRLSGHTIMFRRSPSAEVMSIQL